MKLRVLWGIVLVLFAVHGVADTVDDLHALGDGLAQSPERRVLQFPDEQTENQVFYVVPDDQKSLKWWWPYSDFRKTNLGAPPVPACGQVTIAPDKPIGLLIKPRRQDNPFAVLDNLSPDSLHTLLIDGDRKLSIDENVSSLTRLTYLKSLILDETAISKRAIAGLESMKNLKRLCITEALDGEDIETIAQMKNLTGLRLFGSITDASLESISAMEKLEELFVDGDDLTDESIRLISTMKNLKQLVLVKADCSEQGLQYLTEMNSLENLHLLGFEIGPEGAGHIAGIPNLISLRTNRPISDPAAEALKKCPSLKELELSRGMRPGYDLSDTGLKSLSEINSLESLSIYYGRFTDEGLKQLSTLSNLKRLSMPNTTISDEAENYLIKNLPNLQECEFRSSWRDAKRGRKANENVKD